MMLINGVETDQITAIDRGLQYGDGLFETIAVVDGEPEFWQQHLQRLQQGGERLALSIPDAVLLQQESEQLIAAADANIHRWVLKITVTRGSGGRGYRYSEAQTPTRILSLSPWPYSEQQQSEAVTQGVMLHICNTRLGENPTLAGIKHLNRLEQVLARNEWSDPAIAEGVVMNPQGEMVEGTMSNLFFVQNGELVTPELKQSGVVGVMRQQIIQQLQQQGVTVAIRPIPLQQLILTEEAFCCNSLMGVWPIRKIGGISFYAPGPITKDCIQRLKRGS
ncbi:MAG: aminodeoxychorismate lyase [Gammaproteobacteria bacterium]|nr:aminodeoxychorismate lyase [Thiotrichales bacterium]MBT5361379.1 aminodeoxychorismate lyase [Gammaproteobacteria bacterium]MBT5745809.1 aminodeoxychorismate lyase [Gammaproteobacteria bacterium]MBT8007791.1 aminodeoxychorismate lyase [Gammaproteobacteria bacterium]